MTIQAKLCPTITCPKCGNHARLDSTRTYADGRVRRYWTCCGLSIMELDPSPSVECEDAAVKQILTGQPACVQDYGICPISDDLRQAYRSGFAAGAASVKPDEGELAQEKARRIYYQDIVYAVCNLLDRLGGRKVVCGHVNAPSCEVQNRVAELVAWNRVTPPSPAPQSVTGCRNCGKPLLKENLTLADGCPCNTDRGVNHGLIPDAACTCIKCDPKCTGSSRIRYQQQKEAKHIAANAQDRQQALHDAIWSKPPEPKQEGVRACSLGAALPLSAFEGAEEAAAEDADSLIGDYGFAVVSFANDVWPGEDEGSPIAEYARLLQVARRATKAGIAAGKRMERERIREKADRVINEKKHGVATEEMLRDAFAALLSEEGTGK